MDEFTGAPPESAVRQFVESLLPSPCEELRLQAQEVFRDGNAAKALALLEAAAVDPENDDVKTDLAEILLEQGRHEDARPWLENLSPLAKSETRATNLAARIEFAAHAEQLVDPEALRSRISADGGDLDARLALARYHAGRKDYEKALEHLLEIIRRDRKFGDDIGRRTMLSPFNLLGNDNDLVGRYRRRLASALN
ncbi:MAG: tetratricopeptide repeat protein [Betaproteobacteria bacterium]|nr:tetratricopeptide repeat protein [Betaproteobacteria bacterium]